MRSLSENWSLQRKALPGDPGDWEVVKDDFVESKGIVSFTNAQNNTLKETFRKAKATQYMLF